MSSTVRPRPDCSCASSRPWLPDLLAAGMTDYVAIISRFVAEGVIGEMDGVYTSWATRAPKGRPNRRASAYRATPRSKPLSGASLRRHRALAAALRLAGGGKAAGEAPMSVTVTPLTAYRAEASEHVGVR
jgi:hypothetical protein